MLGARDPQFIEDNPWEASVSWRYQKSDRHFRGSEEEQNRQAEHSEVINTIHVVDFGLTHHFNNRWSASIGIPFLMAERSSPIRNDARETIGRSISQARAMGDVILGARRWMLDPATHPKTNVQLGFGIKLPTGPTNVTDTRTRFSNDEYVRTIQTVDQSIQPGDGGFGAVLDVGWFRRLAQDKCALYFSGTYLFNPDTTNGVYTYRSREAEAIMSVADQFLARVGATFNVSRKKGLSVGIGGRFEGVPSEDLIGSSYGFRRPGHAVSVEPSLNLTRGAHSFSVALPYAVYRNRTRSVPDRLTGRHGDAAFADWLLLVNYSHRFGNNKHAASAETTPTCESAPE